MPDIEDLLGDLGAILDVHETNEAVIQVSGSLGNMVNIMSNDGLTDQQKAYMFQEQIDALKPAGVDLAFAFLEKTGIKFDPITQDKFSDYLVSDKFQNLTDQVGGVFDKGVEMLFNKTGLTARIEDLVAKNKADEMDQEEQMDGESTEDFILRRKEMLEMQEGESAMSPDTGMVLPDELPKTGADISDVSITNLTADLEANTDLLFQKIEKYKSTVQGI